VWNNFVNAREIPYLIRRLRHDPRLLEIVLSRVPLTRRGRTRAAWAHTERATKHWWDIPAVMERWNLLITGDAACGHREYVVRKYCRGRQELRGLSLGCGGGNKELAWDATGAFRRIEAYDISENRIRSAREEAARRGVGARVDFRVGDAYEVPLEGETYDVIITEDSLHHFTPLEPLLRRLHDALAPDGLFVLNEFVGPSRFQWTDRQIEAVNSLLSLLPVPYRTLRGSKYTKVPVVRPSRLGMILKDPSEAVESSRILPLVHELFDVKEVRGYGGAILHLLFAEIAHHFLEPDEEGRELLRLCFESEDLLTRRGDVGHDFALAVCGRRRGEPQGPPRTT
jgi:SAM-dependent methyltransferase